MRRHASWGKQNTACPIAAMHGTIAFSLQIEFLANVPPKTCILSRNSHEGSCKLERKRKKQVFTEMQLAWGLMQVEDTETGNPVSCTYAWGHHIYFAGKVSCPLAQNNLFFSCKFARGLVQVVCREIQKAGTYGNAICMRSHASWPHFFGKHEFGALNCLHPLCKQVFSSPASS